MKKILIATLAALLTSSCATPQMKQVQQDIVVEAEGAAVENRVIRESSERYYREVDAMWFGDETVEIDANALPPLFNTPVQFTRQYPVTLQVVAGYITTGLGVPVDVTADAVEAAYLNSYDPVRQILAREGEDQQAPAAQPGQANGGGVASFVVQFQGTLRGLLDEITSRTGNSWRYSNGRVVIYNVETRTYTVHALPGATTLESRITNESTGGGTSMGGGTSGGGGTSAQQEVSSGQSTSISAIIEIFESAKLNVESMLSPRGRIAVAPSTGTISVTDTPAVLDRVAEYVADLNRQVTQQVVFDVRVYAIELQEGNDYGIDWNIVWESLNGRYGVETMAFGDSNPDQNSLNISVIDETFNYFGSNVMVNALSKQGDLSIKTSAAVATLSNQPVPVQVAEETSYLAEVSTTLVNDAGSQTTLSPGTVTTGFSMTLLPVVMEKNEILLQLQVNLSALRELREISVGDVRIETPQVDSRQFLQRVKIGSGDTLVLSGFEQERLRSDMRGIGDASFALAGGSKSTERRRTVLVVTVTPKVVG